MVLEALLPQLAHQRQPVKLLISLPGAGVLVFWQLGVLKGLQQQYDLGDVPMLGSSSGALVSALAKSGACMEHAAHRGMELLKEYKVEQRPFGLIGILGRLTRQWLNDVLPEGAADKCTGGAATLLVTTLPFLRTRPVTDFRCRRDLIDVVMASSHIPIVVDPRAFVFNRWRPVIDGGLWWLLRRSVAEYRPPHALNTLLISPFEDKEIVDGLHIFRRIKPTDLGVARELLERGKEYAQDLSRQHGHILSLAAQPAPLLGGSTPPPSIPGPSGSAQSQ